MVELYRNGKSPDSSKRALSKLAADLSSREAGGIGEGNNEFLP
jgi:hypothetical protein